MSDNTKQVQVFDGGDSSYPRKASLTLSLSLLAILPLIGLGLVIYAQVAREHRAEVENRLQQLASVRSEWLNMYLADLSRRQSLATDRPRLEADISAIQSGNAPQAALDNIELVLNEVLEADPDLVGAAAYDVTGRLVIQVGVVGSSPYDPASIIGRSRGPLAVLLDSVSSGSGLVLVLATPVQAADQLIGYATLHYAGDQLLQITIDHGLGETGEVLLGERDISGVMRFITPVRFGADAPLVPVGNRQERLPIDEALDGNEALLTQSSDYRGVPVVAAVRYIEATGWGLVTKIDRSEAQQPLASLRTELLTGILIMAGLILGLAYLVARELARRDADRAGAYRMLRLALEKAPFPAMLHAEDGEVLITSESWTERTGYRSEEISTIEEWLRLGLGDQYKEALERITSLYGHEDVTEGGTRQVTARTGEVLTWNFKSIGLGRLSDGRRIALSMAVDVTEQQRLLSFLTETTERLNASFEATPVPMFYLDSDGLVQRWNRAAEQVFGWSKSEAIGRPLPFVPDEKRAESRGFIGRILEGEEISGIETVRQRKDGSAVHILAYGAPVRGGSGTIEGVVGLSEDISRRKQDEESMERLNRALKFVSQSNTTLVRHANDPELLGEICRVAIETGGYAHIWVASQKGNKGRSLYQFSQSGKVIDILSLPSLHEELDAVSEVGLPLVVHDPRADGGWERELAQEGYHAIAILPFPRESSIDGFIALAHERADALDEAEIVVLQELVGDLAYGLSVSSMRQDLFLIEQAIASLPIGVCILDASTDGIPLAFVNHGFTETTGYSAEEALGRHCSFLQGPDTADEDIQAIKRAFANQERVQLSILNYKKSGEPFWNRLTLQPITGRDGTVKHFVAIQEDVTKQRQLGVELEHRSRLAAVGELAGGVAHDFRNILTASQGLLELAIDEMDMSEQASLYLSELKGVVARGNSVTERLLSLSRKSAFQSQVVRLNELLSDISSLISHTLRDDVRHKLETSVPDDLCVRLDRDQLITIMLNLVRNAEQAMPDGGSLRVRCGFASDLSPDELPVDVDINDSSHPWVHLSVIDTGSGMNEETLEHCFDPYFTTKPEGEGTGLGLPTVYAAIGHMGGRIWLTSMQGRGTTANIILPTAPAEDVAQPEEAPPVAPIASHRSRTATILLAENDESVLRVFTRALERQKHKVIAANNGRLALDHFESHPDTIDLLVTDGIMPELNGAELAKAMWSKRPDIPVILTSGFGSGDINWDLPDPTPAPIVFRPKPLLLDELIEAVDTLLGTGLDG